MIGRLLRLRYRRTVIEATVRPSQLVPLMVLDVSGEQSQESWQVTDGDSVSPMLEDDVLYAIAWADGHTRYKTIISKAVWDGLRQSPNIRQEAHRLGMLDNPHYLEFPTPYVCGRCQH
ncbi:MAG: hypothetical protein AB7L92_05635 [Alphaproteobacteria bacterium]